LDLLHGERNQPDRALFAGLNDQHLADGVRRVTAVIQSPVGDPTRAPFAERVAAAHHEHAGAQAQTAARPPLDEGDLARTDEELGKQLRNDSALQIGGGNGRLDVFELALQRTDAQAALDRIDRIGDQTARTLPLLDAAHLDLADHLHVSAGWFA